MARYQDRYSPVEYMEGRPSTGRRSPEYGFLDPRIVEPTNVITTIAPAYGTDYRDTSRTSVSIVRPAPQHQHHRERSPAHTVVVQEPVIEHEHHHLHHHIDHGEANTRLAMARIDPQQLRSRDSLSRQYSYDDLDIREQRYTTGASVATIGHTHQNQRRRRRHRHRHRSRDGSVEQHIRFSRSDMDLPYNDDDTVTIIDVPSGSRRVYVNIENKGSNGYETRDYSSSTIDWRRERGIRRSRGLGSELWTEITKDLVTREAIEEYGYPFEETEYFYYIFEYLDREQIAELRELTDDIRHERVRDLEYQSISGGSQYDFDRRQRSEHGEDARTEIIIENAHGNRDLHRRRYH